MEGCSSSSSPSLRFLLQALLKPFKRGKRRRSRCGLTRYHPGNTQLGIRTSKWGKTLSFPPTVNRSNSHRCQTRASAQKGGQVAAFVWATGPDEPCGFHRPRSEGRHGGGGQQFRPHSRHLIECRPQVGRAAEEDGALRLLFLAPCKCSEDRRLNNVSFSLKSKSKCFWLHFLVIVVSLNRFPRGEVSRVTAHEPGRLKQRMFKRVNRSSAAPLWRRRGITVKCLTPPLNEL